MIETSRIKPKIVASVVLAAGLMAGCRVAPQETRAPSLASGDTPLPIHRISEPGAIDLDELATIVTAAENRPVSFTNKHAAYYYTHEAPEHWTGHAHSTIFKARPDEKMKGWVLMPMIRVRRAVRDGYEGFKGVVKKAIGREA